MNNVTKKSILTYLFVFICLLVAGCATTIIDTTGISKITESLLRNGFSEEDIQKIMGQNVVNVLLDTLLSD